MKIIRTNKQFTEENMSIDFIKKAVAISCSERNVTNYPDKDFKVEVNFCGRTKGSSVHPWTDDAKLRGYIKTVSCVYITLDNGFDSYAIIFNNPASIQGYFKKSNNKKIVCQVDTIRWTNLLLDNGFIEIK